MKTRGMDGDSAPRFRLRWIVAKEDEGQEPRELPLLAEGAPLTLAPAPGRVDCDDRLQFRVDAGNHFIVGDDAASVGLDQPDDQGTAQAKLLFEILPASVDEVGSKAAGSGIISQVLRADALLRNHGTLARHVLERPAKFPMRKNHRQGSGAAIGHFLLEDDRNRTNAHPSWRGFELFRIEGGRFPEVTASRATQKRNRDEDSTGGRGERR